MMSENTKWQCQAGECFLRDVGGKLHLFFILTNPLSAARYGYGEKFKVLSVNISTIRDNIPYDNTCEIEVGEHPFIKNRSFVVYSRMMIDNVQDIENMINNAVLIPKESCSIDLLKRILQGALDSDRTSQEFQNIIAENMPA